MNPSVVYGVNTSWTAFGHLLFHPAAHVRTLMARSSSGPSDWLAMLAMVATRCPCRWPRHPKSSRSVSLRDLQGGERVLSWYVPRLSFNDGHVMR